jgi:feruloyl-CoA synthase
MMTVISETELSPGIVPRAVMTRGQNGEILVRSTAVLDAYPDRLLDRLDHWAATAPDRTFLCVRSGAGWRRQSYRETVDRVDAAAARLLSMHLSSERPLLTLAQNSIDLAIQIFAAMRIGVPVAVVSPQYLSRDPYLAKLVPILAKVAPGALFCDDPAGRARLGAHPAAAGIALFGADAHGDSATAADVAAAAAGVGPDTVAKILFTSGSTGVPKGVINTQRMLCSNMASIAAPWPFLNDEPPVLVDWLPWNHTFGGNACLHMALYYGGTFYIDDGRPTPDAIGRTLENLRLATPTLHCNVPVGLQMLLSRLASDDQLAARFLRGLRFIFAAGAALPGPLQTSLADLAVRHDRPDLPIVVGWGSTETAPFASVRTFASPHPDNLGVPMPGMTIKLAPVDGQFELRVKGPNVTPGYWREPEATLRAFDEAGYYRMGDLGVMADASDAAQGIRFAGRIAEQFKLYSGTWVDAGALRQALLERMASLADEVLICGENQAALAALIFVGQPDTETLRAAVANEIEAHNRTVSGGSMRIARFLLVTEPLSAASGEITEKGSINRRAVLANRADLIDNLYREGHRVPVLQTPPVRLP